MIEVADDGLRMSLEAAVGHAAPFAVEELAGIKQLVVTGARTLRGLRHCPGIEELTLFGCEVAQPDEAALPSLTTIRLLASTVETLAFLRGLPKLTEIEVNFCLVRDIEPLLSLGQLRRARLMGNPLDDRSFHELRPKLAAQPLGAGRPPMVVCSAEHEWRITRRLFDRGLRVGYGTIDGPNDGPLLVRPGIAKGLVKGGEANYPTDDVVDYAETSERGIQYGLDHAGVNPTTEEFVATFFTLRAPVARGAARFQSTLIVGDADDARGWLAQARTSDETRATMTSFVDRFAQHRFHRDRPEYFRRLEAQGIRYPAWFRLLCTNTLAFVGGDRRAKLRVDTFDIQHSPRSEYANRIWYRLSLNPVGDAETQALWAERCAAQPFADWPAEYRSWLCLSIKSNYDMRVFEAAEADLRDAVSEDGDPMQSIYTVFTSWASLLGHIVDVEVE